MEGTDKLDMSLDDLIEQSRRRGGGAAGRGRHPVGARIRKPVHPSRLARGRGGRGRGRGGRPMGAGQMFSEPLLDATGRWKKDATTAPRRPPTQGPGRFQTRPRLPHRQVTIQQRPPPKKPPQQLPPTTNAPPKPPPTSEKLFLSNLEYRVSERDLLELFSQIGPLRHVRVNYDKSGRSLGTGEVVFEVAIHAAIAESRFNGILIDSKPLVIQKGGPQANQPPGPTTLTSGITVVDPNQGDGSGTSSMPVSGRKPEDVKAFHTLKSAVVATIAPDHPSLNTTGAGPRIRSSIMRSGMYSDRMDIS